MIVNIAGALLRDPAEGRGSYKIPVPILPSNPGYTADEDINNKRAYDYVR